jgi:hypothetical protein
MFIAGFFPLEQDLVQGPFKDFFMVIFLKFKDFIIKRTKQIMYVYAIYWIKDTFQFQAYIFYTWQDANSHCPHTDSWLKKFKDCHSRRHPNFVKNCNKTHFTKEIVAKVAVPVVVGKLFL